MKRLLLLLLISFCCFSAQSQSKQATVQVAAPRPKVGLVLSGGGAKGAAHIGVLKYLEEIGIPVDYVAGTSIGSIVGGLYSMGYSPDELAELIGQMNWSEYVGNQFDRSMMSSQLRHRNRAMVLNLPFQLKGLLKREKGNASVAFVPNAYVNNTALINLFNDLCVGYQKEMDFNNLPIPFACVATEVATGKEYVFHSGSVPTAMRASMAIPGVFSPVVVDGHLLVDGGLSNNFPADLLHEMGADLIIGVELADKIDDELDSNTSLPELLSCLITNAISNKRAENQALCNVLMAPDITGYGTLSFNPEAIDTLVNRGYKKAEEYHDQLLRIKQYVDSAAGRPVTKELRAPKAKNLAEAPVFIRSITINQSSDSQGLWLMEKSGLKAGQFMTERDIDQAIKTYRGTGAFNEITYNITENGTDTIDGKAVNSFDLVMNFKPSQPHVFGFGARYDSEEGAGLLLNVGFNEKRLSGFKLSLTGRLSYNPRFNLTATYALLSSVNFNIAYDFRSPHFKVLVANGKYSNLHFVQRELSGYVSQFQSLNLKSAIGFSLVSTSFDQVNLYGSGDATTEPNLIASNNFKDNWLYGPYFKVQYDNMDHNYFARHGINVRLGGRLYFDPSKIQGNVEEVSGSFESYITPKEGHFTIIPQFYSRLVFGDNLFANLWNAVGGEIPGRHSEQQMPFIGMNYVNETCDFATIMRCDLRYNFLEKHYITATYNFLIGFNPATATRDGFHEEHYSGLGLRYSYNSILGPVALTAQWSDCTHRLSAYFSLGYNF